MTKAKPRKRKANNASGRLVVFAEDVRAVNLAATLAGQTQAEFFRDYLRAMVREFIDREWEGK